MEELKILIDMVAQLPAMALWVLVGFWCYKVICIGSIYGVIRMAINKLHDYLVQRKEGFIDFSLRDKVHGITISSDNTLDELMIQLRRLPGIDGYGTIYIHKEEVDWLRSVIDAKERANAEAKAARDSLTAVKGKK